METSQTPEDAAKAALAKKREELAASNHETPGTDKCAAACEAFAMAQNEFGTITFDKENPHFKNKYASLSATLKATLPALNRHGIALMSCTAVEGDSIIVKTHLVYKGLFFASAEWGVGKLTTPPQQLGSALTYARRYTVQSILGVAGEEDDDGNLAQQAATAKPESDPF